MSDTVNQPDSRYDHGIPSGSPGMVLGLTTQGVQKVLDQITDHSVSQVLVFIGDEGTEREVYYVLEGDLRYVPGYGLQLHIPEAVAESLRQKGRRRFRRDLRNLLGLS